MEDEETLFLPMATILETEIILHKTEMEDNAERALSISYLRCRMH